MRNFFLRLMAGRYGIDQLHNALLVLCFALLLLSRLLHIAWLDILSLLLLLLCYFRCFSRNINARYRENQKFLAAVQPLRKWFGGLRQRFRDRCIRLPMIPDARSLNLSNTVAVCVYEALRQTGFPGLTDAGEMAGR